MDQIAILISGFAVSQEQVQAVLQLPAELDRTWNERDPQAFASLFDQDGTFRLQSGLWIEGQDAIERFWREEVFAGLPAGMRHVVTTKRVHFVTDSVAVGDGRLRILVDLEGQEQVHVDAEGTLVAVKKAGRWCIAALRLAKLVQE
jgi:uncharacterized protein (TIGR02246 family)